MNFPDDLIETISWTLEGDNYFAGLRLHLELAGYDPEDEATFTAAKKAAQRKLYDRRGIHSAMGRFSDAMLSHAAIGEVIGMKRPTVQAIACGRMKERYFPEQKEKLRGLIKETIEELRAALDLLG